MAKTLKYRIDLQQKSHTSWLVTTIKKLKRKTANELRPPVFSFKWTQDSALHKINILATFN